MQSKLYYSQSIKAFVLVVELSRAEATLKWFASKGHSNLRTRTVGNEFRIALPNDYELINIVRTRAIKVEDPNTQPRQQSVTVDTLKKQLSNLSHYSLNQLAKKYGIDGEPMSKSDKIAAIAAAAYNLKHAA